MGMDVSPQQRIEDMIRVTELCIDLLKENEEHHGEVSVCIISKSAEVEFWTLLSLSSKIFIFLPIHKLILSTLNLYIFSSFEGYVK